MAQFSPNGNKVKNIVAIVQQGISLPFVAFSGEFSNFYNFFCYIYILSFSNCMGGHICR
jgi:hypothetical protein